MNETINSLLTRRSIRKYKPEQFPDEAMELILKAALHAPSARNTQPWHITALRGQGVIDQLTREVKAATARMPDNPYAKSVGSEGYTVNFHAPTFVIVSADPSASPMVQADCALLLGNMFNAARSLNIGSCWVNQLGVLSDEPGFRKILSKIGIPEKNRIYGCAALGYPDGPYPHAAKRSENTVNYVTEAF